MALAYFTLAELRALPDMADATRYPDARVTAVGEQVEGIIERCVQTSFVARTVTDEVHSGGVYGIVLDRPHVLSLTSATEAGVAVTDDLRVSAGIAYKFGSATATVPLLWSAGHSNVKITYSAGYASTPPADVKEAALRATRFRLLTGHASAGMSERARSVTNEFGNVSLSFADADHPFGLPEVDEIIVGWRDQLAGYGFA